MDFIADVDQLSEELWDKAKAEKLIQLDDEADDPLPAAEQKSWQKRNAKDPRSEGPYTLEPNGGHFLLFNEPGLPVAKVWDEERAQFFLDSANAVSYLYTEEASE